ncbi:hypothetical protein [Psychrobacter sp. P2G3]|uniref:hypothetical protein n=1 Tax=Psychrobacter sp. P2G3 TaxID=1699622 RepID=UPI00078C0756|nr:hypothetical protein [Psychrobacter sp. P2G3]AMN49667.1 hypothetical protein AK823_07085 [Psychrobacter sp. P2G3]
MPMRPIDAIFVHPEKRLYVVYFRGELWQLPRMKIDHAAWQRRQPYNGDVKSLYLSRHQAITDPILAQKLRTLNLPEAVRGSTLHRFEDWWEVHGFEWLRALLHDGKSPLAAHQSNTEEPISAVQSLSNDNEATNTVNNAEKTEPITPPVAEDDIFDDMLADLTNEVLHHRH